MWNAQPLVFYDKLKKVARILSLNIYLRMFRREFYRIRHEVHQYMFQQRHVQGNNVMPIMGIGNSLPRFGNRLQLIQHISYV